MATAAALDFTYRYSHPSALFEQGRGRTLGLATCGAKQERPHFFDGRLREPRVVGDLLLALTEVVRTHFFKPVPALLDPVVTSNEEMLRFEGFSGCCGVYARVDLAAEALDSEIQGRGTTNVDFNDPMRASLMRLRDTDEVRLAVGAEGVTLTRAESAVVEKKVKLPLRWVKGFSEVQVYQPQLEPVLEVSAAEALPLVQQLPKSNGPRRPSFVVRDGRSLRLSLRESSDAVRVSGIHRLRVLQTVMRHAERIQVWADAESGTSGWDVRLPGARFFLMLSPELQRGFSGEGQLLETLASSDWKAPLASVRAQLRWQNQLDVATLASAAGLDEPSAIAALTALGARGLAGFDVATGRYFHRELPFDLERVEALQPRLKNARGLLDAGGLRLLSRPEPGSQDVSVPGTGVDHHVRLRSGQDRCSCPWFSRHQGQRGPCKHILAARLWVETAVSATPVTAVSGRR